MFEVDLCFGGHVHKLDEGARHWGSESTQSEQRFRIQYNGAADKRSTRYSCTLLQKLTARETSLGHANSYASKANSVKTSHR